MSRTEVTFLGKTLQSPVFAGAGPNTQTVENCLKALENGVGAIEVSFIRGNNNIFDDHRRTDLYAVLPNKADAYNGRYYGLVSTGMHVKKEEPEAFIDVTRKKLRRIKEGAVDKSMVIANIGAVGYRGDGVYTWGEMAAIAEDSGADALSLHLQTGNLMAGGVFSKDPEFLKRIVAEVKKNSSLPIIAKLPIEGCEPSMLADDAFECGVDAVASTGRFIGLVPDIDTGECLLGGHIGFGGSWVLPNTCAWAARMYTERPERLLIPGGGVNSWKDIISVVMCGGILVQACTWPMLNGFEVIADAVAKMEEWLKSKGYQNLDEIRGMIAVKATRSPDLWARRLERTATPKYGISIHAEQCKKCYKCVPNCYFDAIEIGAQGLTINPDKCMGCGCCQGACPFDAIY